MASRTSASVMLKKPAPRAAKNRKTTPIDGTARPALVTLMTRKSPRLLWPAEVPMGSAIAVAIADGDERDEQVLAQQRQQLAAANLRARRAPRSW